jgi:hypothetical protein
VPTVRGTPDHGAAWSRLWRSRPDGAATVECPGFSLTRRLRHEHGAVIADYELAADPGTRFIWAAHALLDLSPAAVIHAPAGTPTRLFPEAAGAGWVAGPWPDPSGLRLDTCGPVDGTALGAILTDCPRVRVTDGPDELQLALEVVTGQPASTALWRNLGGFPADKPYRSIGVEPMLGAVFDLADAGPADAAVVPACGRVEWRLILTARSLGHSR